MNKLPKILLLIHVFLLLLVVSYNSRLNFSDTMALGLFVGLILIFLSIILNSLHKSIWVVSLVLSTIYMLLFAGMIFLFLVGFMSSEIPDGQIIVSSVLVPGFLFSFVFILHTILMERHRKKERPNKKINADG